jgi:hypothetical protein
MKQRVYKFCFIFFSLYMQMTIILCQNKINTHKCHILNLGAVFLTYCISPFPNCMSEGKGQKVLFLPLCCSQNKYIVEFSMFKQACEWVVFNKCYIWDSWREQKCSFFTSIKQVVESQDVSKICLHTYLVRKKWRTKIFIFNVAFHGQRY